MVKGDQPPADDITLRDVIEHMNHKFDMVEARFDKLERKVEDGFTKAKGERAEILKRVEAEASASDDTLEKLDDLTERVVIVEKQLALPAQN